MASRAIQPVLLGCGLLCAAALLCAGLSGRVAAQAGAYQLPPAYQTPLYQGPAAIPAAIVRQLTTVMNVPLSRVIHAKRAVMSTRPKNGPNTVHTQFKVPRKAIDFCGPIKSSFTDTRD